MADADKIMTIDEVHRVLNLYKIMDNEKRAFIIDYINEKPMHEIVEMIVHLSRGKDIKWVEEEVIKYEEKLRNRQREDTKEDER